MTQDQVTVAADGTTVRAVVRLPGRSAQDALAAFTDPVLLKSWWGGELTVGLDPLGRYAVHFPFLEQTMDGRVLDYRPGELLVFSWDWAHQPEQVGDWSVTVRATGTADGARLDLVHGPRDGARPTAEAESVEGHREGWAYFLPRLAAAV
ncbi:SRPBCC domain-containing protein [Kitasatospora sp. NPDC002040]|uniref:SRPBCC family protein n=1 Tax=Kitasatospora sp. NPDC002040 TaxID=3154661 RepID=UPI003328590D